MSISIFLFYRTKISLVIPTSSTAPTYRASVLEILVCGGRKAGSEGRGKGRRRRALRAVVRAIICGKPEMRIGEIDIMATLKSELPPATLWSTERWR